MTQHSLSNLKSIPWHQADAVAPQSPIHHISPPPYESAVIHHDLDDKAAVWPAPTTEGVDYEKIVPSCAQGHDTGLRPRCKAIIIGSAVINPCYGLAFMLCPQARRRVCKRCGERVMVPIKRAFC